MLPPVAPVVVVQDNQGGVLTDVDGRIAEYSRYHVQVVIKGGCWSACTMLSVLPPEQVCIASDSFLAFHHPYVPLDPDNPTQWDIDHRGDPAMTRALMRYYPARIRHFIKAHGGLTARWVVLKGAALRHLLRVCPAS